MSDFNDNPPPESPFSEYARKSAPPRQGGVAAWTVAGLLGAALAAALILWASSLGEQRSLRRKFDDAQAAGAAARAKLEAAQAQAAALQNQVAELQREKEEVGKAAKGLEDELRSDLESKDVTISRLQGKLTVNILDRVLFDSGEAVLKPDGEAVLRKVAGILSGHPEIKIHVIGHTDNVPIRARYASNWELSTARALAAVHFLTEQAGVDPKRVGAVGYGEFRPLADNATAEGRAKNRRIAITILPDELAGADTTNAPRPLPASSPVTNSAGAVPANTGTPRPNPAP